MCIISSRMKSKDGRYIHLSLTYLGKKRRFFSRYAFRPLLILSRSPLLSLSFSNRPCKLVACSTWNRQGQRSATVATVLLKHQCSKYRRVNVDNERNEKYKYEKCTLRITDSWHLSWVDLVGSTLSMSVSLLVKYLHYS